MTVVVRPATIDDAADIARIQVRGWHEAYTGRIPQSVLDAMDESRHRRGWARMLAGEAPAASDVQVAERDGRVIGFASSGECRDDDAVAGRRELYAIYVLAEDYGSGAGAALLDVALGREAASLWVLADNPRAHAFYAKHGFVPDGAAKDDDRFGPEPLHEVRLVRDRLDP
jgi:GNAT superfamily N-acetyltransferase